MAKRRELIAELIEDYEYSGPALLDSLVAALSEHDCIEALKHVMKVEDWRHRLASNGEIILANLEGKFETGASDHSTNEFILEAVNIVATNRAIKKGFSAEYIKAYFSNHFHPETDLSKVNLMEAETYFEQVVRGES